MKSPFGQVVFSGGSGSFSLPIIHTSDTSLTVADPYVFGKLQVRDVPRDKCIELSEVEYNRFNPIPYIKPTYKFTGFFGDLLHGDKS